MQMLKDSEYCMQTIKGSRFLAFARPIQGEEEAKEFLHQIREEHPKASHHCFAWRFADGEERMSDDGEPRGSAGAPMLKRLISLDCVDSMVVVVRYFGGTKLGIGGLIRAYGGVVQELLENATFVPYQKWVSLAFSYSYSDSNIVDQVLAHCQYTLRNKEYGTQISIDVLLLESDVEEFQAKLYEPSSGRITSSSPVP